MYTPVIDDKPADDIICSLHCVGVGANVGIIEGDLDGDLEGPPVGEVVRAVGDSDGIDVGDVGDMDGINVGIRLGSKVGGDDGEAVEIGLHSNTYLS